MSLTESCFEASHQLIKDILLRIYIRILASAYASAHVDFSKI